MLILMNDCIKQNFVIITWNEINIVTDSYDDTATDDQQ